MSTASSVKVSWQYASKFFKIVNYLNIIISKRQDNSNQPEADSEANANGQYEDADGN